jgi:hypothetical protein
MTEGLMKYNPEGKRKAGWICVMNMTWERQMVNIDGEKLSTEMDSREFKKTPKPPKVVV